MVWVVERPWMQYKDGLAVPHRSGKIFCPPTRLVRMQSICVYAVQMLKLTALEVKFSEAMSSMHVLCRT
jgi:hypothetical protein